MVLGLGTGSTARFVLEALAARRARGELGGIVGVATSRATMEQAGRLGIPLTTLNERPQLDLAIDGADEVDPQLDLIKGLGGALLWEKIVARAAARFVVVADESKLVTRLGERAPLPVEVVAFGWRSHLAAIRELGAEPVLRLNAGDPFITDSSNHIIDCRFDGGIPDPAGVHEALKQRTGIVETGLFAAMTEAAVIGHDDGARVLRVGATVAGREGRE